MTWPYLSYVKALLVHRCETCRFIEVRHPNGEVRCGVYHRLWHWHAALAFSLHNKTISFSKRLSLEASNKHFLCEDAGPSEQRPPNSNKLTHSFTSQKQPRFRQNEISGGVFFFLCRLLYLLIQTLYIEKSIQMHIRMHGHSILFTESL